MDNLGVEFYRNYVGIENPLMVNSARFGDRLGLLSIDFVKKDRIYFNDGSDFSGASSKFDECKPILKLPEDLTDEEWLYVFNGDRANEFKIWRNKNNDVVRCYHKSFDLSIEKNMANYINSFDMLRTYLRRSDQEVLNRGYSLHWNQQAKQLIENGLALNINDLK